MATKGEIWLLSEENLSAANMHPSSTYFELLRSKCDCLIALDCHLGNQLTCGMLYYGGGMSGTVSLYSEDNERIDIEIPDRIKEQSGIQYRYKLEIKAT